MGVLPFPPTTDNSRHAELGGGGSVAVGSRLFLSRPPTHYGTSRRCRSRSCGIPQVAAAGVGAVVTAQDRTSLHEFPRRHETTAVAEEDGIEMTEDGAEAATNSE